MTQPRPPRKTVLVLDDDKAVTSFVSAVLREAGYNVLVAFDPIQAYRLAQQAQPSLILLDLHMPAGGGMSVLDRVMASIRTQAIPVVIMS
ncbi:MAG: response regulator, partial [Gemmatimonadota bacterium]